MVNLQKIINCIPKRAIPAKVWLKCSFSSSSVVLKILVAAMENVDGEAGAAGPSTSAAGAEGGAESSDFYNTGRVGRRNALPDILSSHATVSTADLPDQLSALTTSDKAGAAGPVASTSSSSEPTPSTSQIATTSNSWKYPISHTQTHIHSDYLYGPVFVQ